VEILGALIILLLPSNDLPLSVYPKFLLKRYKFDKDFGHAAADSGRIHVDHLESLEWGGELSQVLDHVFADYFGVFLHHGHAAASGK